jgi:diketogulonate reductase-like aldo/keto reductase
MQRKRREFLTALGAASAAGVLPGGVWAQRGPPERPARREAEESSEPASLPAAPASGPPERAIPRTGERLPIVGLGSTRPVMEMVQLGEQRVEQIVRALVQNGGRVVDTWPRNVSNDTAFGRILASRDLPRLFVTINLDAMETQAAVQQFERTLRAYQRESIDLVNVGSLIDLDARWPLLKQWQQQGRTRYVGVTAAQASLYPQLEEFVTRAAPDFVEINYSVTERGAEERLLPLLADLGIAVLVSRPFMNGDYFDRLENTPLPDWTAELECTSWAQFSLQYILANPAVTCVLTETTDPAHMAENVLTATKPAPDDAARERMRAFIAGL